MTLGESSVSEYFNTIANEFVKKGYQVVIFTDKQQYNLVHTEGKLHILTWPSMRPTTFVDAKFFYKQVKLYEPTIIISNFGSVNLMTLIGFILRVKVRITWVHTLSTQLAKASYFLKLRKSIIYRFATEIITNSAAMKNDIVSHYEIDEEKVQVFANALSIKERKSIKKKNTITYVGRLHSSKGVDILITAFSLLLDKEYKYDLEIIGSGEEENVLKRMVKELEIESNVHFLGSISKEEVLNSFNIASFAVIPSRSEAFGYVVIEAMSVKTAVVAAAVGGIPEIISDEKNGLLFKPESAEDLLKKMCFFIDSPEKLQQIALAGFETVKERYSNERIASDFVNYINNKEKND